jgi:hypothetical protein
VRLRLVGFLLVFPLVSLVPSARAQWQEPTPDELKMTADPAAPGQAAMYLYREETVDDKLHIHTLYARLKILSDKGKAFADVDLPTYGHGESLTNIAGRTIHSDGKVIPFTGKPMDKVVEKTKTYRYQTKVFTMPDVQVGSILEYRYTLRYDDDVVVSPHWYIQQPIYVHKAHYVFTPTERLVDSGKGGVTNRLVYSRILPPGAEVKYVETQKRYELDLHDISALPDDDYLPPIQSLSYRLIFYYTGFRKEDEFWKAEGAGWSKDMDHFANPGKLGGILAQIVAPADTPQQKLQKIYAAVMTLDNTSFTRAHSAAENKAQRVKIKTAADIWEQKRGNDDEITLLFIGLARAAGLKAYAMAVTNRDQDIFWPAYLSFRQLDDLVAIVVVDNKDEFFDPGQRYCEFGEMHWKHTMTEGIRQTDAGVVIAGIPGPKYKETQILRIADLTVTATGEVTGVVRMTFTGAKALEWRQRALSTDEAETKKEFEDELQAEVPAGIEVKTNHFVGLTKPETPLMVVVDVTGSMATATQKRMFLPSSFFEASTKPLFVAEKRENPVDLRYPYTMQDTLILHLPATMAVESLPQDGQVHLGQFAVFGAKYKSEASSLRIDRGLILGNALFLAKEYPDLRDFFQKVNSKDQEQVVLKAAAVVTGGGN